LDVFQVVGNAAGVRAWAALAPLWVCQHGL